MRSIPRSARTLGFLLAVVAIGNGGGPAQGADRTKPHKIKSATHHFVARSIVVPASLAHFEIVANDKPKITIVLTGLAKLVDTVQFDVSNGILTIQDESTRLDYTIVSDRQNIIVGSGNVIVNNIGTPSSSSRKATKFSESEMKLLPLTFKISAPKRIAVRFEGAMGRIKLSGLTGNHQIELAANGALSAERLAGQLSLKVSDNTATNISRATLDRLSIHAGDNAEVEFSGSAKQASASVTENAEIEISGTADKADFSASENGTITASGDIKSVTQKKSDNADIEVR